MRGAVASAVAAAGASSTSSSSAAAVAASSALRRGAAAATAERVGHLVAATHGPHCPCCARKRASAATSSSAAATAASAVASAAAAAASAAAVTGGGAAAAGAAAASGAATGAAAAAAAGGGGAAGEPTDYAVEVSATTLRFGPGVAAEVGHDAKRLLQQKAGAGAGAGAVAVVTDPHLVALAESDSESALAVVLRSLEQSGLRVAVFGAARCEPTDASMAEAVDWARGGLDGSGATPFGCFVGVGGGSAMDTAKVANLFASHPDAELLDFVNPPVGRGAPIPGALAPSIAVPTTAGTGSEATGTAIFDFTPLHAKTGIASKALKPTLALVDPLTLRTLPPTVAAAAGFDVLSHALESYTAVPYTRRTPRPATPSDRPAYQGSNPFSDVWALRAVEVAAKYLARAVEDPDDDEARHNMMLASASAGVGFGSSGVHLPHALSYPVAGLVKTLGEGAYRHPGYPETGGAHPIVPHGVSVVMHAPAVFEHTAHADPERHVKCAQLLGGGPQDGAALAAAERDGEAAGKYMREALLKLMRRLEVPDGLEALGYTPDHIPALVAGTLPQQRITKLAPLPTSEEDLSNIFQRSMRLY